MYFVEYLQGAIQVGKQGDGAFTPVKGIPLWGLDHDNEKRSRCALQFGHSNIDTWHVICNMW